MTAKQCEKVMLQQVNQLWDLLDDMSENNPEAYQKFIQHHLEEGMKQFSLPEAHICFQTRILELNEKLLYVNLCTWSRVPAPKSKSDPVPLAGGRLEETVEGREIYSVTDVAYNPEVLKEGNEDPVEKDQLIRLAMKYIEEQHCTHLSYSYTLLKDKLKGSKKQMKLRLTGKADPMQTAKHMSPEESGASLLQQLAMLKSADKESEDDNPQICLLSSIKHPKKPGLIEEISSTEFQSGKVETPKYKLLLVKDGNEKTKIIQLKIELPGVFSVKECDLSVSKDDLVIDVTEKYRLQLDLPETISEETVTANSTRRLTSCLWRCLSSNHITSLN